MLLSIPAEFDSLSQGNLWLSAHETSSRQFPVLTSQCNQFSPPLLEYTETFLIEFSKGGILSMEEFHIPFSLTFNTWGYNPTTWFPQTLHCLAREGCTESSWGWYKIKLICLTLGHVVVTHILICDKRKSQCNNAVEIYSFTEIYILFLPCTIYRGSV